MSTVIHADPQSDEAPPPVPGRRSGTGIKLVTLVLLLAAVNTLSFMDRMALGVLGVPIRSDLALSGTEFGLLTGAAFAILYALVSLPVARAADRVGPGLILPACVALWSVAVLGTAFANSFETLAATRLLIALGEAGAAPIAYALIGGSVSPSRRATALAIVAAGAPLGSVAGATIFPALATLYGWRDAFLYVGLCGTAFALLLWPALRLLAEARSGPPPAKLAIGAALTSVLRHPDQRALAIGYGAIALTMTAVVAWMPQLLQRWHGLSLLAAGQVFGTAMLVGGLGGTLLIPPLMALLSGEDRRRALRRAMALVPCGAALTALSLLVSDTALIALLAAGFACLAGVLPLIFARVPDVAHDLGAAEANVGIVLAGNLIGASLGPLIIGLVDDAMSPAFGAWGLGTGLLMVLIVAPVGAAGLAGSLKLSRDTPKPSAGGLP